MSKNYDDKKGMDPCKNCWHDDGGNGDDDDGGGGDNVQLSLILLPPLDCLHVFGWHIILDL